MRSNLGLLVVCAGSLVAGRSAWAAPGDPAPTASPAPRAITPETTPMADSGVGASIGGGIGGFTDRMMGDPLEPTGAYAKLYSWEASADVGYEL